MHFMFDYGIYKWVIQRFNGFDRQWRNSCSHVQYFVWSFHWNKSHVTFRPEACTTSIFILYNFMIFNSMYLSIYTLNCESQTNNLHYYSIVSEWMCVCVCAWWQHWTIEQSLATNRIYKIWISNDTFSKWTVSSSISFAEANFVCRPRTVLFFPILLE